MPVNRLPKASPATGGEFKALDIVKPDTGNTQVGAIGDLLGAANRLGTTVAGLVRDINKLDQKKKDVIDTSTAIDKNQQYVNKISKWTAEKKAAGLDAQKTYYDDFIAESDKYVGELVSGMDEGTKGKFLQLISNYREKYTIEAAGYQAAYAGAKGMDTLQNQYNNDVAIAANPNTSSADIVAAVENGEAIHDSLVGPLGKAQVDILKNKYKDSVVTSHLITLADKDASSALSENESFRTMGHLTDKQYEDNKRVIKGIEKGQLADIANFQKDNNDQMIVKAFEYFNADDMKGLNKYLGKLTIQAGKQNPDKANWNESWIFPETLSKLVTLSNMMEKEGRQVGKASPQQTYVYNALSNEINNWKTGTGNEITYANLAEHAVNGDISMNQLDKLVVQLRGAKSAVKAGDNKKWAAIEQDVRRIYKSANAYDKNDTARNEQFLMGTFEIAQGLAGSPDKVTPEIIMQAATIQDKAMKTPSWIGQKTGGFIGTSEEQYQAATSARKIAKSQALESELRQANRDLDNLRTYIRTSPQIVTRELVESTIGPVVDIKAKQQGITLTPEQRSETIDKVFNNIKAGKSIGK